MNGAAAAEATTAAPLPQPRSSRARAETARTPGGGVGAGRTGGAGPEAGRRGGAGRRARLCPLPTSHAGSSRGGTGVPWVRAWIFRF